MARVWLIRHGQSEANAGLPSSSPSEIALTALGHRQAEAIARRFDRAPTCIVHSPFLRAIQTSAPTRARFPQAPEACWQVQEFTYLASARCRDTTSAERLPLVHAYWARADPEWLDGPGGESFAAFVGRVDAAVERFRAGGFTALFTHGQFLQACMWRLMTGPCELDAALMTECRRLMVATPIPNGAVLEMDLDDGVRMGPLATDHLEGLPITY